MFEKSPPAGRLGTELEAEDHRLEGSRTGAAVRHPHPGDELPGAAVEVHEELHVPDAVQPRREPRADRIRWTADGRSDAEGAREDPPDAPELQEGPRVRHGR